MHKKYVATLSGLLECNSSAYVAIYSFVDNLGNVTGRVKSNQDNQEQTESAKLLPFRILIKQFKRYNKIC